MEGVKRYSALGRAILRNAWGVVLKQDEADPVYDAIYRMDANKMNLCLLCYIAELLEPISLLAKRQLQDAEENHRNIRREKTNEIRQCLTGMYRSSDNKAVRRVISAVQFNLHRYHEDGNNRPVFYDARYISETKPKEWKIEVIKSIERLGKTTIRQIEEYLREAKNENR